MENPEVDEPKVGNLITEESPWAIAFCKLDGTIENYMTVGRFHQQRGLSALITTKKEIDRIKGLGFEPKGLKLKDGKIQLRHRDKIKRRQLELLQSLNFKSQLKLLRENTSLFVKTISWHLGALLSASMIASGFIFALTPPEIVTISGMKDYLSIFLPLFATSIAIISLFTSIHESRKLASEERHHSVRPLIFLSFTDHPNSNVRFAFDKLNLISLNRGEGKLSGTLQIDNHGLGLITNLRFFIRDGKSKASFSNSVELIKPGETKTANMYISGLGTAPIAFMYSVGENIYGGTVVTAHIFGQQSTPEGNQTKIIFNRQVEPHTVAYKKILRDIES
ncbi:hypothetical protein [Marinobacter sp. F4206]|uniref:hypothetical protein n=1 Tax=Marinobacter sp. F4206 TaxID=2861777 RepID=UPI001C5E6D7C|nr:hypothetical protein [Marinobacter sp. F4206]MBW4933276.1 hypothetical protein [Marinobacter sp. F4206]